MKNNASRAAVLALERLTRRQQTVVYLRVQRRMTTGAIAKTLAITVPEVEQIEYAAWLRIQAAVKGAVGSEPEQVRSPLSTRVVQFLKNAN